MDNKRAKALIKKYTNGECTPEEKAIVESWFLKVTENKEDNLSEPDFNTLKNKFWTKIQQQTNKHNRVIPLWPRIAAAASILLILSFGGYFILRKPATKQIAQNKTHDIAPGQNQATLTLANGQKIILTKGLNGKLAQQGNMAVKVNSGNAIAYTSSNIGTNTNSAVLYNTLSTKRGEQSPYPLVLADGSKVWLDAASSITFPTAFTNNERLVKITGQAWLEVAHDETHPFKVAVKGQIIQDIGTVFNINAYDNEPAVKTTLIQGAVNVSIQNASNALEKAGVRLKPGQQAVLKNKDLSVSEANIEQVSAWHNGLFEFHDADVPTVMRQLSRWYDVDVSYEGNIPNLHFSGNIYRNVTALKVSDILSFENIHFRIDGKKIIVEP